MDKDPSHLESTTRFSNRVENYAKYRPGYPAAIIPFFERSLGLSKDGHIADIGSGTGLFSELLLENGYSVVGVEPNSAMRKAGEARLSGFPKFVSQASTGETTELPDHSIDLITVAQTFHWLELNAAIKEFKRILKPGGKVVLIWNIRKKNSPFMKAISTLKDQYRTDGKVPDNIDIKKISAFFGPGNLEKVIFPNEQLLDIDAFKGQVLSSSYIPLPGQPSYETMILSMEQLFVQYNVNGFVKMEFETIVYWGERA